MTVENDRLKDFTIKSANIYTPGQGIGLQRLSPEQSQIFKCDHSLAYGSWYDIQIIGYPCSTADESEANMGKELRYLTRGVCLSHSKVVTVTQLTKNKNTDHGVEWQCSSCKEENIGSLASCEYCFTNKAEIIIKGLSFVPVIGILFSITNTALQCGKAKQSNTTDDNIDATLAGTFS